MRPANFPNGAPGSGLYVGRAKNGVGYAVLNLQGRTFMDAARRSLSRRRSRTCARIPADVKVIIVDMHAEATSEKQAMGWYLDGKVSAVLGTHTHVPTADNHVLPQWHGLHHGRRHDRPARFRHWHGKAADRCSVFWTRMPARFSVAEDDVQMNTVLMDVDESTGRARSIERLNFRLD